MASSQNPQSKTVQELENLDALALVLHEMVNLLASLLFDLSDFAEWGGFKNSFSKF